MGEVGIVGSGPRVEVLARLLQRNQHRALIWSEGEGEAISGAARVERAAELASRVRLIFVAVPSWRLSEVAHALGDAISGAHALVHAAHGLEGEGGSRFSEVLRRETPARQVGALLGASVAPDHLEAQPGAALISSRFPSLIKAVQSHLATELFRVYGSTDIVGAEIAAAGAGVVSVAVGLLEGLSMGASARGLLMARGVAELGRLSAASGGQERTGAGMAGLGFLVAQTTEPGGVEYVIGRGLSTGRSLEELRAGYGAPMRELEATSAALSALAERAGCQAYITQAVHHVLSGQWSVGESVRELLTLRQMME
jgi:glycerol-3-phosphate dehydrogenase (NAD(P)+)